jgi:hypothetical protein
MLPVVISRRAALLGGGLTAAVGLAGCSSPDSGPKPQPPAPRTRLPNRAWGRAETLAASVGVNVHFQFRDTVYGQTDAVADWVRRLGVGLIRDRLGSSSDNQARGVMELAAHGVRAHMTCGVFDEVDGPQAFTDLHAHLMDSYRSEHSLSEIFASFGGPNEPNDEPRADDWAERTRVLQADLWNTFRQEPTLDSLPIVGPALKVGVDDLAADFAALGDMSPWCDYGDFHHYTMGHPPAAGLASQTSMAEVAFPGLPLYCTEGGYNTGTAVVGGGQAVPDDVAAVYLPRMVLEHYRRRQVFFVYELLDDPDPNSEFWQAHYGLVTTPSRDPATWRAKPAFDSLSRLFELARDESATSSPPAAVQVTADEGRVHHVELRKRDGTVILLLWQEASIFDPSSNQRLEVELSDVEVAVAQPAAVRLWHPTRFNEPTEDFGVTSSVQVPTGAEVCALEIQPVS